MGQGKADVGGAPGGAIGMRRRDHQRDPVMAAVMEDVVQLARFARPGDRQHDIACGNHAKVAVARLTRMQIQRRGSRRTHGGRDLARDMPALAHAGDDDASRGAGDGLDRPFQRLAEIRIRDRVLERDETFDLDIQRAESRQPVRRRRDVKIHVRFQLSIGHIGPPPCDPGDIRQEWLAIA